MIAHEHPNPIAVLDAAIADLRASGDTGHVENLLHVRTDFMEAINIQRRLVAWNRKGNGKEREISHICMDAGYFLYRIGSAS